VHMQSSANVQLTPEEEMTVSVSAKDLCHLIKRTLRMVGMSWLPICDGNKGIPYIPIQKFRPGLF